MLEKEKPERNTLEIVRVEGLVPHDHLLRKIDSAVDFTHIYDLMEELYCTDNGRPSVNPVIPFKMVLIQHLYGIPSLRHTVEECSCTVKKQETENKRQTAGTTLFRTKENKDQKTSIVEMCITGYGISFMSVIHIDI